MNKYTVSIKSLNTSHDDKTQTDVIIHRNFSEFKSYLQEIKNSSIEFIYSGPTVEKLDKLLGFSDEELDVFFKKLADINVPYDSKADTVEHILRIQELMHGVIKIFIDKCDRHDRSKLSYVEKSTFDKFTPLLKKSEYGSEEYKGFLKEMGVALKHHYESNKSHHPDLLPDGINSMTLFDLVEMIVDWKAATERHDTGDVNKSIKVNKARFNMTDQLARIFSNTVELMNWGYTYYINIRSYDFLYPEEFIKSIEEITGQKAEKRYANFNESDPEEFKFQMQMNEIEGACFYWKVWSGSDVDVFNDLKKKITDIVIPFIPIDSTPSKEYYDLYVQDYRQKCDRNIEGDS